ncbi:MAG: response regulator [Planctomycetota bacterium]|nr:MAG: response regulator [Planctomycetota bacterium]
MPASDNTNERAVKKVDKPRSQKTILIVDDEAAVCHSLKQIVEGQNYKALTVSSGQKAISFARIHQVDLVILDVRMPGMDGFAVLKHLKDEPATAEIPVVMCSVVTDTDEIRKAGQLGASGYIVKPFNAETVEAKVERLLSPLHRPLD